MIKKWDFAQLLSIFVMVLFMMPGSSLCDTTIGTVDDCSSSTESSTCPPEDDEPPQKVDEKSSRMVKDDPLLSMNVSEVCGRRLYPQARIFGGVDSTFGKWPWQISVQKKSGSTYKHDCGAVLLNENWALTAGHCVKSEIACDLLLRMGSLSLNGENTPLGFEDRKVSTMLIHPNVDWLSMERDIALLRFDKPLLKFQVNILPICLPEDDEDYIGKTAMFAGWGKINNKNEVPPILQELDLPVLNNTDCEQMYAEAGQREDLPHESFVCASYKEGDRDTCKGDSGGALMVQRESDKRWIVIGVSSWGKGCAIKNQPGLYTRVSTFRDWIRDVIKT